jgi:hypothetical protein
MQKILTLTLLGIGMILIGGVPKYASAEARPACALTATVEGVTTRLSNDRSIYIRTGEAFSIGWVGTHSSRMSDQNGVSQPVTGSTTEVSKLRTRYVYRFTNGSSYTTCTLMVYPVSGSVSSVSTATSSNKVTLRGVTRDVSMVVVRATRVGATTTIESPALSVNRTLFSYTFPSAFTDGQYILSVLTDKNGVRTELASSTFGVGTGVVQDAATGATTLVVVPVPLLIGGRAHPSATVAVGYLQLINIGTATATVNSITLTQYGNAPTLSVVGVTAITDNGAAKGSVGTMVTGTPFIGNVVTVPLGAILAPREMRLVTIKAITAANIVPYLGTTLTLWVSGVATDANISSKLPLFGTTWKFGY